MLSIFNSFNKISKNQYKIFHKWTYFQYFNFSPIYNYTCSPMKKTYTEILLIKGHYILNVSLQMDQCCYWSVPLISTRLWPCTVHLWSNSSLYYFPILSFPYMMGNSLQCYWLYDIKFNNFVRRTCNYGCGGFILPTLSRLPILTNFMAVLWYQKQTEYTCHP